MKICDIEEYRKHSSGLQLVANELAVLSRIEDDCANKHPNINRFHFGFQDSYSVYMAFDLKTCGDLRYHLRQSKTTSFDELSVAFIAICMADALTHLHARGILHRDIKPENILMDEEGFPHLTDFGVSYLEAGGPAGRGLECCLGSGTREYMAPELFSSTRRHGAEADFWSLGVVLFELLFRARPFEKRCPAAFIKLADYFSRQDVHLTSTGSLFTATCETSTITRNMHRGPQEPQIGETCVLSDCGGQESAAPPSSSQQAADRVIIFADHETACHAPPAFSPVDYSFSASAHDAYVAQITSCNETLSTRLKELECTARWEVKVEASSPPGSESSLSLELPSSLRVAIAPPLHGPPAQLLSAACCDAVARMLDPRPWRRLGAGANLSLLRQHAWLASTGLQWSDVISRRCASPIVLDRSRRDFDVTYQSLFEDEDFLFFEDLERRPAAARRKAAPEGLTVAEKLLLSQCHYVSPTHRNRAPCSITSTSMRGTTTTTASCKCTSREREAQGPLEVEGINHSSSDTKKDINLPPGIVCRDSVSQSVKSSIKTLQSLSLSDCFSGRQFCQ